MLSDAGAEEVVDFTLWPAANGAWQLQACIRGTKAGGQGRLLYRGEGVALTASNWRPVGIAMQADPSLGETAGGLQAPFTLKSGSEYHMFYGDWVHICQAISEDGKAFRRLPGPDGKAGMFDEGSEANARDPMLLAAGNSYALYYTAHPGAIGAVYARTSADLRSWSPSRIVAAGGAAGSGPSSAECPFVCFRPESNSYYLFRTQRYGAEAETRVYCSQDPMDFGIDDDRHLIATLPIAGPEIVVAGGDTYVAALAPDLKAIRVARMAWVLGS